VADDSLKGYIDVPEEDRKKAKVFFDRGKTVAGTGNFEYAIEMYLQGLKLDSDAVEAHQELRDISLKRKASGGKAVGFMEAMKLKRASKDDKDNLLNAEKLLSYDPGNTDHMISAMQSALRAGFFDTVMWMGGVGLKANADSAKPDFQKFIAIKDAFKALKRYKEAADAGHFAARMRPTDMELAGEIKNIEAEYTIKKANYDKGGSFRDSIKDMAAQQKLLDMDKDTADADAVARLIADAEAELAQDPNEPGKVSKLVDLLVKTDKPEMEQRAMDLLHTWFEKTKAFRYRLRSGQIRLKQLAREERNRRAAFQKDPNDDNKAAYVQFVKEKSEFELAEYTEWSVNYPTDMTFRFEMGKRQFTLTKYEEAIDSFQAARSDPKLRTESLTYLGQSFLEAGFVDEAIDTLAQLASEYPVKGNDLKYKELHYWLGRAQEKKGAKDDAIKEYSIVFREDSRYRDVAPRLKTLRSGDATATA
jgi:tetratricopeptide (TPR) repeat protein